jgi:O-antigen/teichoic acid export membrane protein
MVVGTAAIAVSALGFQVIGGRALGADEFSAVGVAWTLVFFTFTVVLIPIEQFITRRLTLSGGRWGGPGNNTLSISVAYFAAVVGTAAFVVATLGRFFNDNWWFVIAIPTAVAARGVMALGRGFLAGRRRFVAYGVATGLEGAVLLPASIIVWLVAPSALAFTWILTIAPLAVLLIRPFARTATLDGYEETDQQRASFLGALVIATGASQIVLAGGPVVVGLLGGSASAVSVYFITFTLFRGPVTSSYNLIARVLPDFTALAASGRGHELNLWAKRLGLAAVVTTAAFGLAGYLFGPAIVGTIYGPDFRPDPLAAGLGAAAVGSALVGLFVSQIYVGRGEGNAMAAIWVAALVAAGLTVAVSSGDPLQRVATGFLVGEVVATLLLAGFASVGSMRRTSTTDDLRPSRTS